MPLVTDVVLSDHDFRRIADVVYEHCGINLHDGKKELVRARLAKRLRSSKFDDFGEYLDHVLADRAGLEFSALIDTLSTNLTSFFREGQHFEFLRSQFLPDLMERKRRASDNRIRAWSAGCSSGEEPYTIAITLHDVLGPGWDAKILATDISTRMLERARRGVYDKERTAAVPPKLRQTYLQPMRVEGQTWFEVSATLRQLIVFRYLNLMEAWPITGKLDFIFCRNVMIYFDKPTQERLVNRFFEVLAPGGVLFTGHSESLTGINHQFRYVQPTVYRKP